MKHWLLMLLLLLCVHLHLGVDVVVNRGVHHGVYPLSMGPSHGVHPAYILASSGQLLTSSTLNWVDVGLVQAGKISPESVIVHGKTAVCRCRFGHRLEPGRTDLSGNCVVRAAKFKQYQVLVDMFAMSRLNWTTWNMFSAPVQGNVAYNDNTFVGLMADNTEDKIIAELDYSRGLNGEYFYYVSEDQVKTATSGLALVETEPIRYSLDNIQTVTSKIVSSSDIQLGSVYLERNDESQDDWVAKYERFEYRWSGFEYWGNVGGTVKGLPTAAEGSKHFKWGLHSKPDLVEQQVIEHRLQNNTGVNITVTGVRVRRDTWYTCTLHSVYRDGSLRVHNISAVMTRDSLVNITQHVSGHVYLDTGLAAPTTTTTTTTTTTVKTVVMVTTTSPPPQSHMFMAPSPTPTLFPPPPAPVTRPNPLKQFYPDTDDNSGSNESQQTDIVRVDILPLSTGHRHQCAFASVATVFILINIL